MTETSTLNRLWSELLIEELIRNGIEYFCISPGSRSTPLTIAVARNSRARSTVCIDERAAAFLALGYARATGRPAALICTSGTAVANYMPAVVEASVDCIPLIVLSADRPPELRQTRANQTIDQPHLFGSYVRWEFDIPCPDENTPLSFVLSTADCAVAAARAPVPGPVHLNCMFREPLAQSPEDNAQPLALQQTSVRQSWYTGTAPYTEYTQPYLVVPEHATERLASCIDSARQPFVVVGRLNSDAERAAVRQFLASTDIPASADISSGLRLGTPEISLPFIDQMLLSAKFRSHFFPDVVLHIGGQIASKRLQQFLDVSCVRGTQLVVAKSHPYRQDPSHTSVQQVHGDLALLCTALAQRIARRRSALLPSTLINNSIQQRIASWVHDTAPISEPGMAYAISECIGAEHALFISNSMPIRDMDMYASTSGACVPVGVNRGASGIDGIIATACGFAAGHARPTTLLIGDLALLHDMNSLVLAANNAQPLVIVAINNSGGGIFSFLPIAQHTDVFEPYFGTQQHFSIAHAAAMAGLDYAQPRNYSEFTNIYRRAVQQRKSTVVEVQTERAHNLALHRELQAYIANDIDALFEH